MFGSTTSFSSSPPQTQAQSSTGFSPYNNSESILESQSISHELWRLARVFLHFPGNKDYPFKHTFLNSSQSWSQSGDPQLNGYDYIEALIEANNLPERSGRFIPVEYIGFTGLNDRVSSQDWVVKRHTEKIQEISKLLDGRNHDDQKVREIISTLQQEQTMLILQLLQVLQKLDKSELSIATEWHSGKYHRTDSSQAEKILHSLEAKVTDASQNGFMSRTAEVARVTSNYNTSEAENGLRAIKMGNSLSAEHTDEMCMFLNEHHTGIRKMRETLSNIQRDLDILRTGGYYGT